MTSATVETDFGHSSLNIQFDENLRIMSAVGLGVHEDVLSWLSAWLIGKELSVAQERVAEALLIEKPEWGLKEAKFVESLLKNLIYQTHKKVEVTGIMICDCRKVSKETIKNALASCMTREEVNLKTTAGSGCGKCHVLIEEMLESKKPKPKRWHGQPYSHWVVELQKSLTLFQSRTQKYPPMTVKSFQEGKVTVSIEGVLNSDQEWDLSEELSSYWAEGLPEPVAVFLDFDLSHI